LDTTQDVNQSIPLLKKCFENVPLINNSSILEKNSKEGEKETKINHLTFLQLVFELMMMNHTSILPLQYNMEI
jgi:uncharacterized protein YihD (DUF1040 family)